MEALSRTLKMLKITPHEIHTLDVPDTLLLRASVRCQCANVVWLDLGIMHRIQPSDLCTSEVLQSKLHSSSQGETLALRLFHKPSKIKALNVFVVDLWSRLHLVYDRLCKTSVSKAMDVLSVWGCP